MSSTQLLSKLLGFFIFLFSASAQNAQSTENNPTGKNGLKLGFSINQVQHDFGLGLNLTSPLINERVSLRLRTNLHWLQHVQFTDSATTWSPYINLGFSAVVRQVIIPNKINVYTEGGAVCILPASGLASYPFKFGGIGLFGFEFIYSTHVSQYFEAGGLGTGAIADKVISNPVFSNGFVMMTGLRFSL